MARMEIIKRQSGAPVSASVPPSVVQPSSSAPPAAPSSVITTPSSTPLPPSSNPVQSTTPPPAQPTPSSTPVPPATTQTTPTTTPQNPVVTSPGNPTTVTSTRPTTTPFVSTTSTSILTSMIVTTEANGAVITTTLRSTIIIVPTASSSGGGGSSNTGAIVGGVAGGIAVILAIFITGLFYWRRSRRPDDFDGNFDPDRVVRHAGDTDLAGGVEVTPYQYQPGVGRPMSGPGSPTYSADGSMRQYRESQSLLGGNVFAGVAPTATSGSHYAPTSSDGTSAHPDSSGHGRSSSLGSSGAQPYRPMSSKEREAVRQRGDGLGLATAPEEVEGDIIQHSDGGRVPEHVPPSQPQEIPPSYDSIPAK